MNSTIGLLIISSSVMVLLFATMIYSFILSQKKTIRHQELLRKLQETQQNQLIEAAVRSEEIERHRIAEALHDEVGAILSSSKLHLQGIKADNLNEREKELYYKSKELLDDGIHKVRGISHNLHSNILKEFGLNEAIRHFISKLGVSGTLKTTAILDDAYTTKNPDNDISIYRMVQEIFNNIIKHAHASEINISSVFAESCLSLTIEYNGSGLSQQQFEELRYNKEGLGLKNIQNRVILLKGNIRFDAGTAGNKIIINIPLTT